MNKKMPKSVRKHIRQEKARLRREVSDINKREDMIKQLYARFSPGAPEKAAKVMELKPKISKIPKAVKTSQ